MQKQNVLILVENRLLKLEDLKLVAYPDSAGNPTIGAGTREIDGRKVTLQDTCTKAQAIMWLRNRIEEDYNRLELFCNMHNIELLDNQAASILLFIYNAGFTAFQNSSMAKDLISGQVDKVVTDLLKWDKITVDGKLVFSPGLLNRREEEAKCFVDEGKC